MRRSRKVIVKVGVVGLGYWGPQLVRNLVSSEHCDAVFACDIDETRLKAVLRQYPTATGVTDLEALLGNGEIDAIVVATPVATHAEIAKRALQADKSVLVEKPLAPNVEQATELISLAAERKLLVMAGHTFLYSAPVQEVRRQIATGEVGTPLYAQCSRVNLGLHQSDVSVIWDLAPHDISILLYWLDQRATRVSAVGRSSVGRGPADVAFIDIEFESGFIANIHLSWLAPTKVRRTTLVGSKRMIVYEDTNPEEPVKIYDKGVELPPPGDYGEFRATYRSGDVRAPRVGTWEPLRAEIDHFLTRIARHETPNQEEEQALEVVRIVDAAEQSRMSGETIALDR